MVDENIIWWPPIILKYVQIIFGRIWNNSFTNGFICLTIFEIIELKDTVY